jgi:hypothetical protein
LTLKKAGPTRIALVAGALALSSLSVGCDDDEQSEPSPNDGGADSGDAPDGSEPFDPYWTGFDAAVDLSPDAAVATRPYVWADWTTYTIGDDGGATATLNIDDASVALTYSGQLYNAQAEAGLPYWTPDTAYKSAVVLNGPPAIDNIMLAGGDNRTHTLTFSAPVTNPVLALMSVGSVDTTTVCRFDDDFELLSFGPGYYPQGEPLKHLPDHVLAGRESNGTIRFVGTYTKISWKSVLSEPWYGLTVGVSPP